METNTSFDIDDSLIRRSQAGDRTAFARLVSLIYELIFRFALNWVGGNIHDAEDVTQQVCIKLGRVIKQFRFESAFTTWLYRIVVNSANDWHRAQSKRPKPQNAGAENDAYDALDHEENKAESEIELRAVLNYVERLGKGFRETLLLVHGEGFSHKEAAEVLNVKESTISWRIHEIRKALSQYEHCNDSVSNAAGGQI